jgi:glycosyltransferase involved in cell wall biosynthesis
MTSAAPSLPDPTVCVIIPCFNHGRYLRTAIDSALAQTHPAVQVLVIDDGSTDDTPAVCRSYADRITCLRQDNAGLSAARNAGLVRTDAEWVHLLDADDVLEPDGIETLLAQAAARPAVDVVRGGWSEIDDDGNWLVTVPGVPVGSDVFHSFFDPLAVGPPCRYLVRRSSLVEVGLFDRRLRSCEDWDAWLRLALTGSEFATTETVVAAYRNHPGSMSKNHARMWVSGVEVLSAARRRHGCARCRGAYRAGVAAWRTYCYLSVLAPSIRQELDGGRRSAAAATAWQAMRRDPHVARHLTASFVRKLGAAQ